MTQPAAVPTDKTTLWGVLGIVLFCCPLLGIVFGVLSMMEAKKYGKQPTLAYVAFGLSGLWILVNVILGISGTNLFNM